jgi:hypothetical protein
MSTTTTETIACPACSFVNNRSVDACAQCGESLVAAKIQQISDDIKKISEKFQRLEGRGPTFSSFNGFGTTLLDYRALGDGTYSATRWVIALFLPIVPLATYVIQPNVQERSYGREVSKFTVLGKLPLSAGRVLRTHLLAVVGLLPILAGSYYSSIVNRTLGGTWAFVAMIACFAWAIYIIFFKLKNEGKAYSSAKAAS